MLQIKSISKQYRTGELVQKALDNVTLNLRNNEFVAILGPSGSGKTTLLNVIGGLDRYDSGDLVINNISTKKYKDSDWDAYRNHTIGFVFQSYNLIPHQSILANVELALTIGGVSRSERRERAKKALEDVGLGDQLHKRPNQMSGGQMQRVAIARALVNNPDVLLADEPTGALDSETSIQVMELLKKVARDRLVVMVTHNPELAEEYATRIVKLRDGKIIGDTNPFENSEQTLSDKKVGKAKMSFVTALSLSFNNLLTKKGRTLLTAFAGSIGIIGIALILALSNGVNGYIADIQKETMTSYPITISSEAVDVGSIMSGMRGQMMSNMNGLMGSAEVSDESLTGIYADHSALMSNDELTASITENDLTGFKQYLDDPNSDIQQYLGENGIVYTYNIGFEVYSYDEDGNIVRSDAETKDADTESSGGFGDLLSMRNEMMNGAMSMIMGSGGNEGAENFSEMMAGVDGTAVSAVITDSYDVLYGAWPKEYNEVVLVLDGNNAISTGVLYQLGLISEKEYEKISDKIAEGEDAESICFDYETVCGHHFYLVQACDHYTENENGTFSYVEDTDALMEQSIELKIVGVIRPKDGAANANISTAVAYTASLTDHIIAYTNDSAVVLSQESDTEHNVLTGMPFEAANDSEKIDITIDYISAMDEEGKASLYSMIMYYNSEKTEGESTTQQSTQGQMQGMQMDNKVMAAAMDQWLENSPDEEILLTIYDEYIGGTSYKDNMTSFGKVSHDAPASISIYTDSFEDKEAVAACIAAYNETVDEDFQISYVDYVELMTSSLTTIINVISYVLIAFVAVSLIVSCIMIGIITHISVLERTKEIGILRALGASKRNISQVFNAETIIVGLCAGVLGIGVSALLTIPINAVMERLLGAGVSANLPMTAAVILILLSMVITVIGGLIPSRKAAKKDPVIALRTE